MAVITLRRHWQTWWGGYLWFDHPVSIYSHFSWPRKLYFVLEEPVKLPPEWGWGWGKWLIIRMSPSAHHPMCLSYGFDAAQNRPSGQGEASLGFCLSHQEIGLSLSGLNEERGWWDQSCPRHLVNMWSSERSAEEAGQEIHSPVNSHWSVFLKDSSNDLSVGCP